MGRKIRIGIDVGGTFTDAVAMDNEKYEIIGLKKIHTTHDAPEGVTAGVIQILKDLLKEINADADDVIFIAQPCAHPQKQHMIAVLILQVMVARQGQQHVCIAAFELLPLLITQSVKHHGQIAF